MRPPTRISSSLWIRITIRRAQRAREDCRTSRALSRNVEGRAPGWFGRVPHERKREAGDQRRDENRIAVDDIREECDAGVQAVGESELVQPRERRHGHERAVVVDGERGPEQERGYGDREGNGGQSPVASR